MKEESDDDSTNINPPPIADFDMYALWMNLGGKAVDLAEIETWTYERMSKVMMTLQWKAQFDKKPAKGNKIEDDPKFAKLMAYQKKVMSR